MGFTARVGLRSTNFAASIVGAVLMAWALVACSAADDAYPPRSQQPVQTLPTAGVASAMAGSVAATTTPGSPTQQGQAGMGATGISAGGMMGVGFGSAGVMAPPAAGMIAPPIAGRAGPAGIGGSAGMSAVAGSGARGAAAGGGGSAALAGAGGAMSVMGETGRMVGMTAAHNAVRAMVQTTPALPPMTWSPTLAAYAQQWTDELAMTSCADPHHRSSQDLDAKGYGENLAAAGGVPAPNTTAKFAVDGWAAEVACWTYGSITEPGFGGGTEKCDTACYEKMNSDGCGHYTQVVWRDSTQVGCGVSSCQSGGATYDIWICNYSPGGNIIGEKPY